MEVPWTCEESGFIRSSSHFFLLLKCWFSPLTEEQAVQCSLFNESFKFTLESTLVVCFFPFFLKEKILEQMNTDKHFNS